MKKGLIVMIFKKSLLTFSKIVCCGAMITLTMNDNVLKSAEIEVPLLRVHQAPIQQSTIQPNYEDTYIIQAHPDKEGRRRDVHIFPLGFCGNPEDMAQYRTVRIKRPNPMFFHESYPTGDQFVSEEKMFMIESCSLQGQYLNVLHGRFSWFWSPFSSTWRKVRPISVHHHGQGSVFLNDRTFRIHAGTNTNDYIKIRSVSNNGYLTYDFNEDTIKFKPLFCADCAEATQLFTFIRV